MPWLARYQPEIDWLARSVKRRTDFDVSEVFPHVLVAPSDWPHVTIVDKTSTTQPMHRASDGPLCTACSVSIGEVKSDRGSLFVNKDQDATVERESLVKLNETVEHVLLPKLNETVEHVLLPKLNETVEHVLLPKLNETVEHVLLLKLNETVEHVLLPKLNQVVEQMLLPTRRTAVEHVALPQNNEAVEHVALPRNNEAVEHVTLPQTDMTVDHGVLPSSDDENSSASSSYSRRSKKSKRKKSSRGRLGRSRFTPPRGEGGCGSCRGAVCARVLPQRPKQLRSIEIASPPSDAASITSLPGLSWKHFLRDLKAGEIKQVCLITDGDTSSVAINAVSDVTGSSRPAATEPKSAREERFTAQSWSALKASGNPVYELACEYADWPLPRDQVQAIDDFFEGRAKLVTCVRAFSPHSSPTFCVKKATGGWRIVHAFNKLNDATIPAQTSMPRNDMVLDSMSSSEVFSAIDLTDGFHQILMRESDVPLTAVSTPSGMLWEWLVMPQGLKNAPATFNRMVSHVLRPLRNFAPSYFDDILVHSRAEDGHSAVEVHLHHLRQVFQKMRDNKLYANLKKCVFCAPEIPVLGCYVSKDGVRADPEKVSSICSWPTPKNQTELRQWLGLANYLHKYTKNYAGLIHPLSSLLKDVAWSWRTEHHKAFETVKQSLSSAPVLMLPDPSKPFHVVCDASDFAIGCALMQFDNEGHERVVSYQSRQMKPAEKNYPVHDKELLAMRYALIEFRVYLLGERNLCGVHRPRIAEDCDAKPTFVTAFARWLSFFSEYNFVVHYKPGKNNILADALSRRPDYDPRRLLGHQTAPDDEDDKDCAVCVALGINSTIATPELSIREAIMAAYADDHFYSAFINQLRSPSDETQAALTRPTRSILSARWFILPQSPPKLPLKRLHPCSSTVYSGIMGCRNLSCRIAILVSRPLSGITYSSCLGRASNVDGSHPETDGQTERVNRVLADVLRSYATSFSSWSEFLPLAEFALNNGVHAPSGLTPFFVNNARHSRVPALLAIRRSGDAAGSALGGGVSAGPPLALALRSSGDSAPELGTSQLGTSDFDPKFNAQHDDADAGKARGLSPREMAPPREVRRRPASPNSAGDSSSSDAPVPTERRASQPRMPADQQSPQAVEPPARHPSPGQPPAASGDTGQSSNAPLRRFPRLHENKSSHEVPYRRDPPPPLVDAAGNERWIVESLVDMMCVVIARGALATLAVVPVVAKNIIAPAGLVTLPLKIRVERPAGVISWSILKLEITADDDGEQIELNYVGKILPPFSRGGKRYWNIKYDDQQEVASMDVEQLARTINYSFQMGHNIVSS
ncbi:unnamed protein product [Phytophthora lilii]|uniref:Unnamed protein product n=1 Tax=Phytophthora lilii TaxID=2077276 RepID=A0A9W6U2W3_9STRA|nr:unnamed protein product [Phytophthora lilii]